MTPDGFYNLLEYYPSTNTYILTERDGTVYTFINNPPSSMLYALNSITDRNGNQMTFSYDGQHRLSSISDTLNRTITFSYTNLNRIAYIQDWSGRQVVFGYDANGDLISVRSPVTFEYPQGKTTHYTYSAGQLDIRMNHKLLTVTDPKEQVYLTNYYDEKGRVETQAYGPAKFHNEYTDATGSKPARVLVTDRNDNQTESWLTPQGNVITETKYTRGIRPGDPYSFTTVYEHITSTERSKTIFPKGNSVEYLYDIDNPDPKARGNLLQVTRNSLTGPPYQLITLFTYELRYNQIKTITDASGNVTTFYYDYELGGPNHGNVVRIDYPTVTHGLAATAHGGQQVIQAYFQYNANGQITQSTSPEGYVDTYEYYPSGTMNGYLYRIHRDINGLNITNTFEYDSVGNITKIYDGKGHATTFQVNQLNQVTKTISRPPFNYEVKFGYDANDNLANTQIQNKDRNGVLDPDMPWLNTFYYYNSLDNLTRKMEAIELGKTQPYEPAEVIEYATTEYGYDTNENRNLITQPEGNQVRHTYDERDLLWETIRGYGTAEWAITTKRYYDINGNLEKTKDGRGKETSYQVDGFDRVIGYTDAVGNRMIRELDTNGNVTRVVRKNASGVTLSDTKYLYDEMNRNYEIQEYQDVPTPTWVITQKEFDKNSRIVKVVDANNHETTAAYDGMNRLTVTTDHLGNHVDYILDANSNVITTTEYEKNITGTYETFVTYNEYDNLDRLIRSTNPINVTRQAFFDSRTNLTYTIDGEGNTATNKYDGLNRLKQVTRDMRQGGHGSGSIFDTIITKYLWDKNSRLKNLTDDKNNTTSYTYDALNRRKKEIYPDARYKEFFYDASDNIYRMTDPNGNQIDNTFDDINRLTHRAITKGTGVIGVSYEDFGYDGLSRMTSAVNDYSSVNMGYDTLSRLLTEQQQIGGLNAKTIQNQYDLVGNRTKLTYPSSSYIDFVPDAINRVTQIKNPSAQVIAGYNYVGYRVDTRTYLNNTKLSASYDGAKRVTGLLHQNISTSQIINQFAYGYDKEDNRLFEKRVQENKGDLFRYDSVYRLTKAQYEVPSNQIDAYVQNGTEPITYSTQTAYNLDGVGNRINMVQDGITTSYTTNILNQYTYVSTTNYTYDYNGNLKDDGTYLYAYDYRNQLMEIKRKSDEVVIASYQYDAFGRRIQKYNNLQATTTRYYYSGSQIVEEYDGNDDMKAKFVYGNGIDEVLTMERNSHTYYYHTNALGSVTEVTDETGVVAESYKYDAYGKVSIFDGSGNPITNSLISNHYLFTGRQLDNESGLYYYRARYYSAELGRFLQRDVLGYLDSMNLYGYVNNNPVNYFDPFGLSSNKGGILGTLEWGANQALHGLAGAAQGMSNVVIDTLKGVSTGSAKIQNLVVGGPQLLFGSKNPYLPFPWAEAEAENLQNGVRFAGQALIDLIGNGLYYYTNLGMFKGSSARVEELKRMAKEIIEEKMEEFKNLSDEEKAEVIGRIIGEIGTLFVAYAQAGKLNEVNKAGLLKDLEAARAANLTQLAPKGKIVIGHYEEYITKAKEIGAKYFDIDPKTYAKMTQAEKWAANQKFLDDAITRGDEIILSHPEARTGTTFEKELNYLKNKGYTVSKDGTRMIPPNK